jgi:WD40 repeat protein
MQKSPFKFLDSYTKDDREIFFGRDREIEELYQKVFDSKLLLVYGVSGTGKSSLIHCGLANKFQETDWLPLVIRRGGNMIESMGTGIINASITPQQVKLKSPAEFKKGVRSLYLDHYKPAFFIFDQFEELFIFGSKEERESFVQVIRALLDTDLQCRFIFILREEYMANITEFERYIPSIFTNRVRVERMSHLNALLAITGPCKAFNINTQDGFAEALLKKLSPAGSEVELTFLQVFLDKIFRLTQEEKGSGKETTQPSFTLSLLEKTGNVSDLLGTFLDDQISLMNDPDEAMTVLKAFVSVKGTKRPAGVDETIDNVRSLGKEISFSKVVELLQTFVNLRVLRDKDDHGKYELIHDSLAEKIFEKFSLAEKEFLEIKQFIENAYQAWLKRNILLSSEDLTYISDKDSKITLNQDLREFLGKSRNHQNAKVKTVRRLTAISAFVLVLVVCIIAYYVTQRIGIVESNYNAVKSLSPSRNLRDRLTLAVSAWEKSQGVLPKQALLNAYNDTRSSELQDTSMKNISAKNSLTFDRAPVKIQYAVCSGDNRYILGYGDSLIILWETNGKLLRTINANHPVIDIKLSDDSKYIGAVTCDSILKVLDINGNLITTLKVRFNILNTRQIFRFTKENNILSLSADHDAVLVNPESKTIQVFDNHKGSVNALDISRDNYFIATASSDKTINIWYLNSVRKRYDLYNSITWHKDTVWSVSFCLRDYFILTASADSTVKIGSLNNEVIDYYELFPKDRKYCYAGFTKSNLGISAISYKYPVNEQNIIISGMHASNPTYLISAINPTLLHGKDGTDLRYIAFSPVDNYFIYKQMETTYLADTKLVFASDRSSVINLLELNGTKHFFTSDGRYVIGLEGNKLTAQFVDVDEIYNNVRSVIGFAK